LLHNPLIDRVYGLNLESVLAVLTERYDIVISLDKEAGPTALATRVQASQKFGFGLNEYGNLAIFNPAADYAYRLGVDDDLKFFRNEKTYQEIIHEVAELPYARDEYVFMLPEEARRKAERYFERRQVQAGRPSIGLNTGAGVKFETKQWPAQYYVRLASLLVRKLHANVFLLGGPRESSLNRTIARRSRVRLYDTGTENSLLDFAGFIAHLDLVVSSDTLGMHLAIGLKKKVVALFGPTCPQEIDLYGRGVKLFSGSPCAPCYKPTCPDARCLKEITPEKVFEEIRRTI
jgi:heptosyltransferase-2